VEIRVSDRGVGIPPDQQERVFEPFVTLGPADRHQSGQFSHGAQGSGLGLAVVKLWVGLHGGTVQVRGNDGGAGTSVVVTLPRAPFGLREVTAGAAG
jgi:signal transduction histidine kinase